MTKYSAAKQKYIPVKWYVLVALAAFVFVLSQGGTYKNKLVLPAEDTSKVLSVEESIKQMQIEDGFEIKNIAAEPLVTAPVAMTFDEKGRIWALEMNAYMPDITGKGENAPSGKVVILEDKNNDGVMDTRTVMVDSLRLPRALCLIEGGLLVAEPPSLWYYPIANGKAGKRVLVDGKYAEGGNVEHSPNGLYRAMDNWIYNAKSAKRYRKKGDQWLIEKTTFRGQWGISQDNYGRLYYNDNSANLYGDYFTPGYGATNADQRGVAGYSEHVVSDTHVYPIHATPGVNRGGEAGTLDENKRLVNMTAACGPLIYRGALFGPQHAADAFVCEPAGNLVKRDILQMDSVATKGAEAYIKKEFLASTDERFRPVSLYDGPDGALYLVDMYRGIIQHETYLTQYLKDEIINRKLTLPLNCGRIYKIVPKSANAVNVKFPANPAGLAALLNNPNGWVRDKAQQLIVDGKYDEVIPVLKANLHAADPLLVIHSMWTLEGLDALQTREVLPLLNNQSWVIRMQALAVLPSVMTKVNYKQYLPVIKHLLDQNDQLAAPYIGYLANNISGFDKPQADSLLIGLVKKYPDNKFVADAVITNLPSQEEAFQKNIAALVPDQNAAINVRLQKIITARLADKNSHDPKAIAKQFPKGTAIFNTLCQTCHGTDGEGRASLAPPLNRSEWVNGDVKRMAAIVLMGLKGPVQVNGHLYKAPEINGDMPGIGGSNYTDEEIAQILSFVRRSWSNNGVAVTANDITTARKRLKTHPKAFTMNELKLAYK